MKRTSALLLLLVTLGGLAWVGTPMVLIRPFGPQTPAGLSVAYAMRARGAPLTVGLLVGGLVAAFLLWPRLASWKGRTLAGLAVVLLSGCAFVARSNYFEWMFRPLPHPGFVEAEQARDVADDDLVLGVEAGTEASAYPVRAMAYHHVVNDVIAGEPIVATYWTLCHTGLVWKSTVDGRTLHFHLTGINNQNFIMHDEETGTWWQQVSGCAILGPLAGRCLEMFAWDEVTFAVWRQEHPRTRVLRSVEDAKDDYASADWEKEISDYPTVTPVDPGDSLKPRDLVVGVSLRADAKAYPMTAIVAQNPIVDSVGETPILILLHPDGRSLRCFDRRVAGATLDLFLRTGTCPPSLFDSTTGSRWDFSGVAIAGSLTGSRLERVSCLKDYWFDWKIYHPDTRTFTAGKMAPVK